MPMGATCTIVLSQKQTGEIESKIMSKATTLYSGYGAKGYFGRIRLVSTILFCLLASYVSLDYYWQLGL